MKRLKLILISGWFFLTAKYHALFLLTDVANGAGHLLPYKRAVSALPVVTEQIMGIGAIFILYIGISLVYKNRTAIRLCIVFLILGFLAPIISVAFKMIKIQSTINMPANNLIFIILYVVINFLCIRHLLRIGKGLAPNNL